MSRVPSSIYALENRLDALIADRCFNEALSLIQSTVQIIFDEPLNAARIFGSEKLDIYCQKIGALTLVSAPHSAAQTKTHIYLATKLQKSGGHTRVIEDLIRAAPRDTNHVILSTELLGASDRADIEKNLHGENVTFEWGTAGDPLTSLLWLQKRLRALAPETVWLFNHHQDASIIAAVQPGESYKIIFYHHGDHHICLGLYLNFAAHIDPLPMGYHHCRHELGLTHNTYLPLWMQDLGDRKNPAFLQKGKAVTCTAARSNKVEVPYFVSYTDMVPAIIAATGGTHIHIGKLTIWGLWKIRRGLKKRGIDAARFVYKTWTPGIWRTLQEENIDLYISSFPYGGARAVIEAMGSATPIAMHDYNATRMLACLEVAYPEAFVWRNPDDLLAYLRSLSAGDLAAQSAHARAYFLKYHDIGNFTGQDPAAITGLTAPALRSHVQDRLQIALDTARQINLRGVIWRFAYRRRHLLKRLLGR